MISNQSLLLSTNVLNDISTYSYLFLAHACVYIQSDFKVLKANMSIYIYLHIAICSWHMHVCIYNQILKF